MGVKSFLIVFLFATTCCHAQQWELEIMPGAAGYQGDLTQQRIPFKSIGPAGAINLKYNTGDMIIFRGGFAWGQIKGDDRDNRQSDIHSRNLNFKTDLWEVNLCAEVLVLDPESYDAYPYLFLGAGMYKFNPYTYDNSNKKTYLQPLSTEGQGLPEYPNRKKYSLTQFCIPFGGGFKVKMTEKIALSFEIGVRFLFTDYLDDVSDTYIDPAILLSEKGPKAVEVGFRSMPLAKEGDQRGNPKANDMYAFSGVKVTFGLGHKKDR
ncbi:MAG: DUF6089 family protein [Chitinophagaceae bacterium]